MSSSQRGRSGLRGSAAVLRAFALMGAGAFILCLICCVRAECTAARRADCAAAGRAGCPPQPPAAQAPEANRPGFVDAVVVASGRQGEVRLADEGRREAFGEFTTRPSRTPRRPRALWSPTHVVGRARCEIAANGAPDCGRGQHGVPRQGFKTGKSVATQTEEKCPARVLSPADRRGWRVQDRDLRDPRGLPVKAAGMV